MAVTAAAVSALLLLAVAGGFLFAAMCEHTRYPSLRGEGQQLYFFAVVFAVVLIFVARGLIAISQLLPDSIRLSFSKWWMTLMGPLHSDYLLTFALAFCLGPVCAGLVNYFTDSKKLSRKIIEDYGGRLERFLYDSIIDRQLIWVSLRNGKVYIGWVTRVPHPKPRKEESREHFSLLPVQSGYLNDHLEPEITTEYEPVYVQILDRTIDHLDIEDFQIIIPLAEVIVVRAFSTDLDQDLFKNGL